MLGCVALLGAAAIGTHMSRARWAGRFRGKGAAGSIATTVPTGSAVPPGEQGRGREALPEEREGEEAASAAVEVKVEAP